MTTTAVPFKTWLDTFVDEKGLNREHLFTVEGREWGENIIPLQCVIDMAGQATYYEQTKIKEILVRIDFANGNPMHFFAHLAKGVAR